MFVCRCGEQPSFAWSRTWAWVTVEQGPVSIEAWAAGGYRLRAWPPVCEERGRFAGVGEMGPGGVPDGLRVGHRRHIRDLLRGGNHAYSSVPQAGIQVFFVSLVVLDPLWWCWPRSCAGRASGWRPA